CLNCNQPISDNDNFCSNCGQVNDELPLSIKQFISEFFSGFFSFDTRFFKTFIPLLFKPGKVSKEYVEGKRRKYVNPFQLYLHVTIVFFLIQGLFSALDKYKISDSILKNDTKIVTDSIAKQENENLLQIEKDLAAEGIKVNLPIITNNDSINKNVIDSILNDIKPDISINNKELKDLKIQRIYKKVSDFMEYDKKNKNITVLQALNNLGYQKTKWNIFYYKKAQDFNRFSIDSDFRDSYIDNVISKISIALFFMLPIFTMFLSLLYLRSKKNYTEHLVLVFNVQTVFFILLILFTLLDKIFKTDAGIGLFLLVFLFYLYKSLRNFYKQSRTKTIVKYFMLNTVFIILSTIGGIIISFLTFVL
ncbi:MAG: DUF3667 domain-containing protein, partial [Flavobacteriaceae bacterium]|nr:DUF3667 domain-containing protein [Flavobacteriaceae bacterium]